MVEVLNLEKLFFTLVLAGVLASMVSVIFGVPSNWDKHIMLASFLISMPLFFLYLRKP